MESLQGLAQTLADSQAFFYPSLMGTIPLKVLGEQVEATHDHGAVCHEIRHFVDRAWLESLEGGAALVSSIVPATPPCTELGGTKRPAPPGYERVLGMLPRPLTVGMKVEKSPPDIPEDDWRGRYVPQTFKVDLALANVLVIDALPVPLHVSMKALTEAAEAGSKASTALYLYINRHNDWKRDYVTVFPERFHSHPYFTSNVIQLGISITQADALDELARKQDHLKAFAGPNAATRRVCAHCSACRPKMKRCGACELVFYCERSCQKAHYQSHKAACRAIRNAKPTASTETVAAATPPARAGSECSICMDRTTDTAIVPCGHLFCAKCAEQASELCHNCRGPVMMRMPLFG